MRRRKTVADPKSATSPAATATETCRNRAPGTISAAGIPAGAAIGAAVRMNHSANPRTTGRLNWHQSRSNSISACRDGTPLRPRNRSWSTALPGAHRSRTAQRRRHCGQDHTAGMRHQHHRPPRRCRQPAHSPERLHSGGSRNGRVLATVPAREPVSKPGRPVHFVTGCTLHRAHIGQRDQTRPVAAHTAPRDRLPPGRFPQHAGVPPFVMPTTRTGQLCHAEESNWMA